MQVQTYRTLMVGEHAAFSMTLHASGDCPAQQCTISASYAEGGQPPLLSQSSEPGWVSGCLSHLMENTVCSMDQRLNTHNW